MDKEIVEHFLDKFVQLKRRSRDGLIFSLYGEIKEVTDDSILLYTDRLGTVLLEEIVSINESTRRKKDG